MTYTEQAAKIFATDANKKTLGEIARDLNSGEYFSQVVNSLLANVPEGKRYLIIQVLRKFGDKLLGKMVDCGIQLCTLAPGEKYSDHSLVLSQHANNVDSWPHPPNGLFVVKERTVYLRSLSEMTIAHECGHALDCALGNGSYFSEKNDCIINAFMNAKNWVTPYAAIRIDEYFAEAVRAYLNCNDVTCSWPKVTRLKLKAIDLTMYTIMEKIFSKDF